jgi:putative transposase
VHPQRPERLKSFDYLGEYRYSLTFCTRLRRHLFVNDDVVSLVLAQFSRGADEEYFAVTAYCFMPDQVHLLVEGTSPASDCRRFIKRSKQYAGFAYSARFGQKLWQPGGFERVLRKDEDTNTVARYIVENPVRAGIAQTVEEYPYVGSLRCDLRDLLNSLPT